MYSFTVFLTHCVEVM